MNRKILIMVLVGAVFLALLGSTAGKGVQAGGNKDVPVFDHSIDIRAQNIIWPMSLGIDAKGNVYLTDSSVTAPRVLKYDKHGRFVKQWGSLGSGPGQFFFQVPYPDPSPTAGFMTVDPQGNVYVSDAYNYRVQKFDSEGNFIMQFRAPDAAACDLNGGYGPIYVDKLGYIYVSSFPCVLKFDPQGNPVASFGTFGSDDGQFMGAGMEGIDQHGNMFLTDLFNNRIQILDAAGNFQLAWGEDRLFMPFSLVLDGEHRVYVADNITKGVYVYSTSGSFLGLLTDAGKHNLPLASPSGLAIDSKGYLYLADGVYDNVTPSVRINVYRIHP